MRQARSQNARPSLGINPSVPCPIWVDVSLERGLVLTHTLPT